MKVIDQAAILHNGIIYKGRRHKDIVMKYKHISRGRQEGFVTMQGLFVDRKEAARLAYMFGQIKEEKDNLKSEDIY